MKLQEIAQQYPTPPERDLSIYGYDNPEECLEHKDQVDDLIRSYADQYPSDLQSIYAVTDFADFAWGQRMTSYGRTLPPGTLPDLAKKHEQAVVRLTEYDYLLTDFILKQTISGTPESQENIGDLWQALDIMSEKCSTLDPRAKETYKSLKQSLQPVVDVMDQFQKQGYKVRLGTPKEDALEATDLMVDDEIIVQVKSSVDAKIPTVHFIEIDPSINWSSVQPCTGNPHASKKERAFIRKLITTAIDKQDTKRIISAYFITVPVNRNGQVRSMPEQLSFEPKTKPETPPNEQVISSASALCRQLGLHVAPTSSGSAEYQPGPTSRHYSKKTPTSFTSITVHPDGRTIQNVIFGKQIQELGPRNMLSPENQQQMFGSIPEIKGGDSISCDPKSTNVHYLEINPLQNEYRIAQHAGDSRFTQKERAFVRHLIDTEIKTGVPREKIFASYSNLSVEKQNLTLSESIDSPPMAQGEHDAHPLNNQADFLVDADPAFVSQNYDKKSPTSVTAITVHPSGHTVQQTLFGRQRRGLDVSTVLHNLSSYASEKDVPATGYIIHINPGQAFAGEPQWKGILEAERKRQEMLAATEKAVQNEPKIVESITANEHHAVQAIFNSMDISGPLEYTSDTRAGNVSCIINGIPLHIKLGKDSLRHPKVIEIAAVNTVPHGPLRASKVMSTLGDSGRQQNREDVRAFSSHVDELAWKTRRNIWGYLVTVPPSLITFDEAGTPQINSPELVRRILRRKEVV